jgi:hypothetical protein
MFKPTGNSQIDRLNNVVLSVAKGDLSAFGFISTGEACYVALAANRIDLLEKMDYTIPEALARISNEWVEHLIYSWQYAGNPAKYASANAG